MKPRRTIAVSLLVTLSALASACAAPRLDTRDGDTPATLRVLFVGNSLTYYNDLSAKFEALHEARLPDTDVEVDMLAAGGASLRDRIGDGSLRRALGASHYDIVVLQDFGSWPLCSTSIPACEQGTASLEAAVALVRGHDAKPLWFGTWMTMPAMQEQLSRAGRDIASRIGVDFADVGEAIHAVPAGATFTLLPDGHPAPLGTWIAAGALSNALDPASATPDAPPEACGVQWQGRGLRGDQLASRQGKPATECTSPTPAEWRVIRAALESPGADGDSP